MRIDEIIGYVGMIFVLLAYYLISTKKVKYNSVFYQLLNFFGAAGIIFNTFVTKSWPSVLLNIIWALIALLSLFRIPKTK